MVEATKIAQLLFLSYDLHSYSEKVTILLKLIELLLVQHLKTCILFLNRFENGTSVTNKWSENKQFAVGTSSPLLTFSAFLHMLSRMLDNYFSKMLNGFLLFVFDEKVVEVPLNERLCRRKTAILSLS